MGAFNLTSGINPNKVFLIKRSEIEGRLEAEYYRPEINLLEKQIRKKTSKKLKDFIIKIASGATPSVTEEDKYYSDKENGIPFLRVQNLQTSGKLYLEDLKYIKKETHQKYLKRSQVAEGDLLVKITGVGRMAIASVAPEGFVGNTNQHMVVIKTKNRKVSEYLANYLNLDLVEKLATRRATGATRPALDYLGLKSIPVIEGIDFSLLFKAEVLKKQKEIEAKALLNSIDVFLSTELGVVLNSYDTSLKNRIFTTSFSEISGIRFDPDYISKYEYLVNQKAKYEFCSLKELLAKAPQYGANEEAKVPVSDNDLRYIRITDIDELGNLKSKSWKTAKKTDERYKLNYNDLLFARSGSVGKCYIHKNIAKPAIFAGYLIRFVVDTSKVDPDFIFYYCNSSIYKFWVSAIERPAVQSNINSEEFKNLPIPVPKKPNGDYDLNKQMQIANHISSIRKKAHELLVEGNEIFENAKKEIENNLINSK